MRFILLLQATVFAAGLLALAAQAHASPKVVAYVPNWIDVAAFAKTIDYPKITHINIAFENPTNDAGELSYNSEDDMLITRAHENHVLALISIGGATAASNETLRNRYAGLLSDHKRKEFAQKLTDYVVAHNADGLDVDLEGPAIDQNYGAFIADLAALLKPKHKLLTAALSQGYGGSKVPDAALKLFDFVNIMAYDAAGSWNPNAPGQHSSLEFAKSNATYWLTRGLPRRKAVLGVPFYGYGFGSAFRQGDYPYSKIVEAYPGAEKLDQAGSTIWYNGIPTIKAKAKYVKDQGLAGVMIWSLDTDVKGERSLLSAIYETLHGTGPGR